MCDSSGVPFFATFRGWYVLVIKAGRAFAVRHSPGWAVICPTPTHYGRDYLLVLVGLAALATAINLLGAGSATGEATNKLGLVELSHGPKHLTNQVAGRVALYIGEVATGGIKDSHPVIAEIIEDHLANQKVTGQPVGVLHDDRARRKSSLTAS